jgi:hypothetical protein
MKNLCIAALAVAMAAAAGTAHAGGAPNTLGIGVESQIGGPSGVSLNFDTGLFHVGGFLGFSDVDGPDNDSFVIGGRFFYHVAKSASADFSVGGSIGIASQNFPDPPGRQTGLYLEPSFQIRAFIVPNVALSFTGGISIGTIDADAVRIGGGLTGTAGVHYYFF